MPKLSARTIEDGREAERANPTFKGARPRSTPRKSEIKPLEVKLPCDVCAGADHPQFEVLKYRPLAKKWLCQSCRALEASAA